MAIETSAKFEQLVAKFQAQLDEGTYADYAREVLADFGVFAFPELERKLAVKRALDKLNAEDIEVLGLQNFKE